MGPDIHLVRELGERYSNWRRWGPEDERGTLNLVTPDMVVAAARLVRTGRTTSMALPFEKAGPQTGSYGRIAGTSVRDLYGGVDKHFRGTDDIVVMPLQSGTQWDALGHAVYDGKMVDYAVARVARTIIARAGVADRLAGVS